MKKLLAIVLPVVAIGFAIHSYMRLTPPVQTHKAQADQWEDVEAVRIERTYTEALNRLPLKGDEAAKFAAWKAEDEKKSLTGDARRAHTKELAKILSPESMAAYKALRTKRSDEKEALSKKKESRMIAMMGEADYKKHLENTKKSQALRQARRDAAKKQAATPTPKAQ